MPPSVTSFFQIILNSTFHQRKLKFPNKFVHESGNELYDTVRLSVPTGCCWDVKVKREDDGTLWLHDGFLEFMQEQSVGIEYFLIFKYEGNSKFIVHIYDLTATEILYSRRCDPERCDVNEFQMVDDTDDSSRCVSGDEDTDDGGGKASGDRADHSLNNEGVDKDSDDDLDDSFMSNSSGEDADNYGDGSFIYESRDKDFNNCGVGSLEYENDVKKSTMYRDIPRNDGTNASSPIDVGKERIIEPGNKSSPNFFEVTLTSIYIKRYHLRVPVDFARLHMPHSTRLIKLVDGENHEWKVLYYNQGPNRALSSGWRSFLHDKKLIVGDVCVFERVLGDEEVKLRVTISRLVKQHE